MGSGTGVVHVLEESCQKVEIKKSFSKRGVIKPISQFVLSGMTGINATQKVIVLQSQGWSEPKIMSRVVRRNKMDKYFLFLMLLAVVACGPGNVFGATNASDQVAATNSMPSVDLTQEMFVALSERKGLTNSIVASVAGRAVPFDQMPAPAKKTIRRMAGQIIPEAGFRDANPIDVLESVIASPPLHEHYSLGLRLDLSSQAQVAVKDNALEVGSLNCSVTNVSDLVLSLVVAQAFDLRLCIDLKGNVTVRNQNDPETKRDTVYVLTLNEDKNRRGRCALGKNSKSRDADRGQSSGTE